MRRRAAISKLNSLDGLFARRWPDWRRLANTLNKQEVDRTHRKLSPRLSTDSVDKRGLVHSQPENSVSFVNIGPSGSEARAYRVTSLLPAPARRPARPTRA